MFTLKVGDVMTTDVVVVRPNTPLADVARLMVEHSISGVPVVDGEGFVLGVVSEADFLVKERGRDALHHRPLARFFGESAETRTELAKLEAVAAVDAMTSPAITIRDDQLVREAAEIMIERRINRLPVVDLDGRLIGIVTRADLIGAFARSDDELKRLIVDEVLVKTLWIDPRELDVAVAHGVVHVSGTVDRRSTAEILEQLVGRVDGVVAVRSDLGWRFDDSEVKAPDTNLVWPKLTPR